MFEEANTKVPGEGETVDREEGHTSHWLDGCFRQLPSPWLKNLAFSVAEEVGFCSLLQEACP